METPRLKRNRVPLSCNQCRASKQKCDRGRPACSQCVRRSQAHSCRYTDRPERMRHGRGVAARLQRLEGMVREMMDEDEGEGLGGPENETTNGNAQGEEGRAESEAVQRDQEPAAAEKGTVVSGRRATSYVGATHFMAILEDIEDLKSYFEDPEEPEEQSPPSVDATDLSPELLLFSAGEFRSKADLLKILPGKPDMDRLIMRYFSELTTSQHIIHKPTFSKQYGRFCRDPHNTPINWIALLFMVLAIGLIFSPPENTSGAALATASHGPERMAQIKAYRAAAGWALVYGRYMQAGIDTIPPLLLFVESEMSLNTSSQIGCYVLLGVCVRLMLKVGLHRDPSKLPNVSPFDAEMRRRMWSLAVTVDLLVSFHVGLPSIIQGIESDTALPQNIVDEDFDVNCTELPPPRAPTEYTTLSYPINKCAVSKVFGKIAAYSHSLTPPSYAEVQRLDQLLVDTWAKVPWTMKPRPLEECITDHPHQIMQRTGLNSLFHKSLCVLHRRYLTEPVFRPEHAVSRKKCLQSALELLRRHDDMWQDMRPGHMFSSGFWFFSVITVYDFLLASAIVYICVQSPTYPEGEVSHPWFPPGTDVPTKADLVAMLKSHGYWVAMMEGRADFKEVSAVVGTMLQKLAAMDGSSEDAGQLHIPTIPEPPQAASMNVATEMSTSADGSHHSIFPTPETTGTSSSMFDSGASMGTSGSGLGAGLTAPDAGVDWRDFENMVTTSFPSAESEMLDSELAAWLETQSSELNGLNFTTPGLNE